MRDPYANERPPLWVGHIQIRARNVPEARAYWQALGMRFIAEGDGFAVLELRGGTHLVIVPAETAIAPDTPAPFDLMVDDIDAARAEYARRGLEPSAMKEGRIHRSFTLRDPSGYRVTVNSSHTSDRPV